MAVIGVLRGMQVVAVKTATCMFFSGDPNAGSVNATSLCLPGEGLSKA